MAWETNNRKRLSGRASVIYEYAFSPHWEIFSLSLVYSCAATLRSCESVSGCCCCCYDLRSALSDISLLLKSWWQMHTYLSLSLSVFIQFSWRKHSACWWSDTRASYKYIFARRVEIRAKGGGGVNQSEVLRACLPWLWKMLMDFFLKYIFKYY